MKKRMNNSQIADDTSIVSLTDGLDEAAAASDPAQTRSVRQVLARFYRTRPFWGCLILALGGWLVLKPVVGSSFKMLQYLGVGGAQVYILGGGMMLAAIIAFVAPAQRHFPAIMAMIFSVASLPLANLGGWILGMMFGIIGSGMVFAWTPYSEKQLAKFAAKAERKAERKSAKGAQG